MKLTSLYLSEMGLTIAFIQVRNGACLVRLAVIHLMLLLAIASNVHGISTFFFEEIETAERLLISWLN